MRRKRLLINQRVRSAIPKAGRLNCRPENETAADAGTSRGGDIEQTSEKLRPRFYLHDATSATISEHLYKLAGQADRLSPTRGDPERFYLDREELVQGLRRLARECGR